MRHELTICDVTSSSALLFPVMRLNVEGNSRRAQPSLAVGLVYQSSREVVIELVLYRIATFLSFFQSLSSPNTLPEVNSYI